MIVWQFEHGLQVTTCHSELKFEPLFDCDLECSGLRGFRRLRNPGVWKPNPGSMNSHSLPPPQTCPYRSLLRIPIQGEQGFGRLGEGGALGMGRGVAISEHPDFLVSNPGVSQSPKFEITCDL